MATRSPRLELYRGLAAGLSLALFAACGSSPKGIGGSGTTGIGGSSTIGAGGSGATGTGGSSTTGAGGSSTTGTGGSSTTGAGGSSTTGTGGSSTTGSAGGAGSYAAPCNGFCTAFLACNYPSYACTLASPTAATAACVASCEAGFAGLSASDATAIGACFACYGTSGGKCDGLELPAASCETPTCTAAQGVAAGKLWNAAFILSAPAAFCTNGMSVFGSYCGNSGIVSSGSGGGGSTFSCTSDCHNDFLPRAGVAMSCAPAADGAMHECACTEGKDKGETFMALGCSREGALWDLCNL